MKLKLFSDKIGRIICGEDIGVQTDTQITIKNPVICNLIQRDPQQPVQLSMLPYVFLEVFDMKKHNDYEVIFNLHDITFIESVGGGDTNNLSNGFISNYNKLFDTVRNIKNQQPEQLNTNSTPQQSNIIEVK